MRAKRVARPDLIERINENLDKALVLVSAPAGFGKSTLLAEWVSQAELPVAWLSLDAGDNDPNRFLRYVIAALDTALAKQAAEICVTAQDMLQSPQPIAIQTMLVALINDWTQIPKPFALVLDDYQVITNPEVHEALTFILEHLPAHVHLVIASRVDPSLPLHRLRAAQRLFEIRTDQLRFSRDESEVFINRVMELSLSREDISTLTGRTEGWIVGLQMAALSMQGIADRPAFVQAFSGSQRYILEYLIEEVLSHQPEYLQSFLLQTSILDRLCGSLCNQVLGTQEDSQAILEHLDRHNIFLTPLDQVSYWYRYHHLFADLLRARLQRSQPEMLPSLHLRASQWYEEARLPEEAIGHALAAQEIERAARLVEQYAFEIMSHGEMSALLGLFNALPQDLIARRPELGLLQAWAFTFSGQFDKVVAQLNQVEKQIQPRDTSRQARDALGGIAIIRGLLADFQGDMTSAVELAQRADELLSAEKWAERTIIPYVMGDSYLASGELNKAEQAFEQIFALGIKVGNPWTVSVALRKLALLKKLQGKLHAVEALHNQAIQFAGERGGQEYGSMAATYVALANLLRERNELQPARRMVTQAIQNMERWQSSTDTVNGYVTLAHICLSQGDVETAQEVLRKADKISRQGTIFPLTTATLEACQVRLWLVTGDFTKAGHWLAGRLAGEKQFALKGEALKLKTDYLRELQWITMVRVLIARQELDRALEVLSILAEGAEAAGRYGQLIEIFLLTALTLNGSGKREPALDFLTKSLALAEPEGYLRIFLDERESLEELLQACSQRIEGSLKAYSEKLLSASKIPLGEQEDLSIAAIQAEGLVEHLTGREAEVLQLLAEGLSNQEIAKRLVVSEGTIKTHTHNLYGKLGVRSRTQAVARAQELKLI
jgi:LuxR family transcriptional regulator, maltose regulon positive regulatory protein